MALVSPHSNHHADRNMVCTNRTERGADQRSAFLYNLAEEGAYYNARCDELQITPEFKTVF